MDALMAALVAGALAQAGDRPAWLAAILADRYKAPALVVLAAAAALLAAGAIMRVVGQKIEAVITRLLGVLLAALAVQFVMDGLQVSLG